MLQCLLQCLVQCVLLYVKSEIGSRLFSTPCDCDVCDVTHASFVAVHVAVCPEVFGK